MAKGRRINKERKKERSCDRYIDKSIFVRAWWATELFLRSIFQFT